MEFLKELNELREEFYGEWDTKWIGRRLEGDAGVWWKIVKNQLTTYEEFKEAFREKFWNQIIQEDVSARLEFGRYYNVEGLNPIQYIEHRILKNRRLISLMLDRNHQYSDDRKDRQEKEKNGNNPAWRQTQHRPLSDNKVNDGNKSTTNAQKKFYEIDSIASTSNAFDINNTGIKGPKN